MILDTLFPPRCVVCDKPLPLGEKGVHFLCRQKIKPIVGNVCLHCGKSMQGIKKEYCFDCEKKRNLRGYQSFDQGRSIFLYKGAMKRSLYRFKYSNRREYANFYGRMAVVLLGEWLRKTQVEAIVPVPMYGKKKKLRGYNQAEEFARALGRLMGLKVEVNWVIRGKNTVPMKNLKEEDRKNNLKNAFQIRNYKVKYRKVLLVDDIFTTGSTADAVTACLREAGVEKVFFVSISIGEGF